MTGPGRVALNYLWLPTWLGMNESLLKELSTKLGERVVGMEVSEDTLDTISDMAVAVITEKYGEVTGLADYLDGIKFVRV